MLEGKLEALRNFDSALVIREGDGTLSKDTGASEMIVSFKFENGASSSVLNLLEGAGHLSEFFNIGDRIQLSGQSNASHFYRILSVDSATITVDEPIEPMKCCGN